MRSRSIGAAMLIMLLATACAKSSVVGGSPSGSAIPYPAGADQLVLRVTTEGGLLAPAFRERQIPQFSLFGDGVVVTPGAQIEIYPQPALPSVQARRLTPAGIQAVLRAALDAGLGEDHRDLTDPGSAVVSDAPTTVITLAAEGVTRTLRVYALGELGAGKPDGMSDEEFALRGTIEGFVARLGRIETWLPRGSIGPERPFEGVGARVFVVDVSPDATMREPAIPWPVAGSLLDFGAPKRAQGRCGTIVGDDWAATVLPLVRTANQLTPWISAGRRFWLIFQPLLPDESGC
jgi:hypothetical protein